MPGVSCLDVNKILSFLLLTVDDTNWFRIFLLISAGLSSES